MVIVALAVLAVLFLSKRDEVPSTPDGAAEAAAKGAVKGAGAVADKTLEDVTAGIGGAAALAGAMKTAMGGGVAGAATAGVAATGTAGVVTAATLEATGESAISGAIQGAANAAGTPATAGVAVGLGSVLAVTIAIAWVALFVNIFTTMGAIAARARKKAGAGVGGVRARLAEQIHGTEWENLTSMIGQLGGNVTTESRADEGGFDKIVSVQGIAPDVLRSLAILARVCAVEQTRGYNSAVSTYYRVEHSYSDADLEAMGVSATGATFESVVADYYAAHPATTWGMLFASYTGKGIGKSNTYVADTYASQRDLMVGFGAVKQLAQAFFVGELAGVHMVDMIPGRVTQFDGSYGTPSTDGQVAQAQTPQGNWMTAAYNRVFFNNRLRQLSEGLYDDVARLGFFAQVPHGGNAATAGPTYILRQPGA